MAPLVILGASGQVGSVLRRLVPETVGTCWSHPSPGLVSIDKRDPEAVMAFFERHRPWAVVDLSARTRVDDCEGDPEGCWRVNGLGTRHVIEACRRFGSFLVFFSTDYVFAGDRKASYTEEDAPRPLNHYGLCKLDSEAAVLGSGLPAAVVRTSTIYGGRGNRPNFVARLLEDLREGRRVRVAVDEWRNPTFAGDLAEAVEIILRQRATGLFHVAGPECLNRYEFVLRIAEEFRMNPDLVAPAPARELGSTALRPRKVCLDSSLAERVLGIRCRTVREGFREMRRQMNESLHARDPPTA